VWIITKRQHISPEVAVKGFNKYSISSAVHETDDDVLWNGSEEGGNVSVVWCGVECEKEEGTACEDRDSDTLTGKGRQNLTRFVYLVYAINSKIFFLSRHFVFRGNLKLG
jgi:hypothetical protein